MLKTLKDFNFSGKRVLVRCDFNVPLAENGNILDDFKIKETLPTIEYLISRSSKIVLMSHLGEPEGKIVPILKLDKIQERLMEYLDFSITKAPDCIGSEIEKYTFGLNPGEILLLENLRFHKEETENDENFSKELSKLGDIYINDAFGACHRAHASIMGLPKYLPSGIGFLLEKEIKNLNKILEDPKKPLVAIIGGKKVETKVKFIDKISEKADFVIISGLIKKEAQNKKIAFKYKEKIVAPFDSLSGFDIDEKTRELFKEKILAAKTILWNGPFGKTEDKKYSKGTLVIANAIIESEAFSVVGGGETVEFLNREGLISKFSHVSTGGGAMLAYLAGEQLPGLKALEKE
jgi:phosphoglycerate kinase